MVPGRTTSSCGAPGVGVITSTVGTARSRVSLATTARARARLLTPQNASPIAMTMNATPPSSAPRDLGFDMRSFLPTVQQREHRRHEEQGRHRGEREAADDG